VSALEEHGAILIKTAHYNIFGENATLLYVIKNAGPQSFDKSYMQVLNITLGNISILTAMTAPPYGTVSDEESKRVPGRHILDVLKVVR
jgi:hypothetical protein